MDAAVIIPTRRRPAYLDVALAGVMGQARALGVPVLVVDDGPDPATRAVVEGRGARYVEGPRPGRGINGARNAGVAAAGTGPAWLLFLDDDVAVAPGWLAAMLAGAAAAEADVGFLTGPIRARFEDHPLRTCGRERPPITSHDLGPRDTDSPVAWGVNMGVRRALLDAAGPFDETLVNGGDEEELQARSGARIRYLAHAAVDHRRAGDDARLAALCRAQHARGQAARRFDAARGRAPALRTELLVLAGCAWHLVRRRCPQGIVMAAHTLGRIEEAWDPTPRPAEDFLSGASGTVGGWRGRAAAVQDRLLDVRAALEGRGPRRPAAGPRRRVLVLAVERPGAAFPAARAELERSRHDVTVATTGLGGRGKFQNLNALLAAHDLAAFDWVLVVDDDVVLPRRFLDVFLRHADGLQLAQPAHRRHSHAAWAHTRRRPGAPVRATTFVEIGPVTAIHRTAFGELLPFPELRMGWGLDAHWAAVAAARGWRMGIVDATPILHATPVAGGYGREEAVAEARAYLAGRPYLTRDGVR
jgi:GT2 family glycosyltransferase